jgi:uncharacterized protein (DUF342 family)
MLLAFPERKSDNGSMDSSDFLSTLLRWTNREDGAYVEPLGSADAGLPDEARLHQAFRSIGVVNAVAPMILKVLEAKASGFQRVGPRFEFSDPREALPISLRVQELAASIFVDAEVLRHQARVLSEHEIESLLQDRGVVYGIDPSLIQGLCRPKIATGWYDVAMGDPPMNGLDAQVHRLVDMEQAIIRHDDESKVDFHEIGRILEATEGMALAEKIPVVPAKPGRDLGGNVLPAQEGRDLQIRLGKNTRFRDESQLIVEAAVDGYIYQQDGLLHVGQVFEVRGDLDMAIGNLRYLGDIKVYGGIKPGFHIEAGGNVWVQGQAEQAEISSSRGKVEIQGAVIGGSIQAATDIKIPFAHDAHFHCQGTLEVAKYLHFCKIVCGDLKLVNPGAFVLGGEVIASHGIELDVAGTEAGTLTILKLADPEEELALRELEATTGEERRYTALREILEPKVLIIRRRLTTGGGLIGKRQYSAVMEKIHSLQARRLKAQEVLSLQRNHQGIVSIRQKILPGVELTIFGRKVPPESIHPPVRVISRGLEIEMTRN